MRVRGGFGGGARAGGVVGDVTRRTRVWHRKVVVKSNEFVAIYIYRLYRIPFRR